MNLNELKAVIKQSGGSSTALEYADELLLKINHVSNHNVPKKYWRQFKSASNQGDFRGRVLEINFIDYFVQQKIPLTYEVTQPGATGDVDLLWQSVGHDVYIEIKLLREAESFPLISEQNIQERKFTNIPGIDGSVDIKRIQYTIIDKATKTKFNTIPSQNTINLLAIDVSELQLGTVDLGDCMLAALGSNYAISHFSESCANSDLIGLFEPKVEPNAWKQMIDIKLAGHIHPRDYIHGVAFLFREPNDTAALSYQLKARIAWNENIISKNLAREINTDFHKIIPRKS
jgi:hypothetical protein